MERLTATVKIPDIAAINANETATKPVRIRTKIDFIFYFFESAFIPLNL